ncbi:hypothetical protein KIL84_013479 [Mauremys mutica]|uniref:Uncharacterized protein n=1 Tax=Mauremys mutica TaxID=74926 RepID=A0A9D3WVJ0_9SAUR|nr:hypothetical protein KIL84_013479 [Mauremys mutica]
MEIIMSAGIITQKQNNSGRRVGVYFIFCTATVCNELAHPLNITACCNINADDFMPAEVRRCYYMQLNRYLIKSFTECFFCMIYILAEQ